MTNSPDMPADDTTTSVPCPQNTSQTSHQHSGPDAACLCSTQTEKPFSGISEREVIAVLSLMLVTAMENHPSPDLWWLISHQVIARAKAIGIDDDVVDAVLTTIGGKNIKTMYPEGFF
ncbi:MAG: hypothetical protein WC284_18485 [Candidimonas sp.]